MVIIALGAQLASRHPCPIAPDRTTIFYETSIVFFPLQNLSIALQGSTFSQLRSDSTNIVQIVSSKYRVRVMCKLLKIQ